MVQWRRKLCARKGVGRWRQWRIVEVPEVELRGSGEEFCFIRVCIVQNGGSVRKSVGGRRRCAGASIIIREDVLHTRNIRVRTFDATQWS